MRGNYQRPSDLLKQQKESGLSYWDLIGRPLYGNPTQEDPAQQAVLNRQIDVALDGFIPNGEYPKYEGGKNKSVRKNVKPLKSRPNYTIGQFVDIMSPIVWNEIKRQGIKNPERVHNYMMRQLGWESWYGNTPVAKKNHNYGGVGHYIKDGEHRYTNYANDEAFVRSYVDLLKRKYGKAIAAPTLRQYSKELKRGGYYEDNEAHYTNNLLNMKSLDRELSRHRKANPKIYNGAKFTPVVLGQTESPVENPVMQYTQPEVVPAPTYAQQPTMQVSPAVQAPTIDLDYELFIAEKQARQDAFDLAMNNVYSKLLNPIDRLGQFMQFNRGKSLNPVCITNMDSPVRKMQKLRDYQRHKLFRKMKRLRKARAEQEQKMAEKELKRKLRRPKFDKGSDGNLLDEQYYSIMERVAKENWQKWGDPSEEAALIRILNDNSYDYRGYYNKYPQSKANADTHWNDEFKTSYHPTFSNESIYSGQVSDKNPKGIIGGSWSRVGKPSYRLSESLMANGWDTELTRRTMDPKEELKTPFDPYTITERTLPSGEVVYLDEQGNLLENTGYNLTGPNGETYYSKNAKPLTNVSDWDWKGNEKKDLNAYLRLGQYMQNAAARDFDKVALGTLALGTAPITMLAVGAEALAPGSPFWTSPVTKNIMYSIAGAQTADLAAKAVAGKTFEEWGEQDLGLPWYLSGFVNPGGYFAPVNTGIKMYLPTLKTPQTKAQQLAKLDIPDQYAGLSDIAEGSQDVDLLSSIAKNPAAFPGYQLKMLMRNNPLEKQISKTGTVSVNNIKALSNKASNVEKAIVDLVLASNQFAGKKSVHYNTFKKAVQDELITYNRFPDARYDDYGMDRLGFNDRHIWDMEHDPHIRIVDGLPTHADTGIPLTQQERANWLRQDLLDLDTYTFESPRIPVGSSRHYDKTTLGHSRTYTTTDEPDVLHVMESLSDWAQNDVFGKMLAKRNRLLQKPDLYEKRINALNRLTAELADWENMVNTGVNHAGIKLLPWEINQIKTEFIPNTRQNVSKYLQLLYPQEIELASYLSKNYLLRQLQENLKYAAERGQTKMRYPTSETAAKIEGYEKGFTTNDEVESIRKKMSDVKKEWNELVTKLVKKEKGSFDDTNPIDTNPIFIRLNELDNQHQSLRLQFDEALRKTLDYSPEHKTILKKYSDFPKMYGKLYKGAEVRTVTDAKGNTWYEVDVPKDYLKQEWLYNSGKDIHIKPSKRGTFTAAAKKHGMGVQAYARKVLKAPKGKYSAAMRRKANFARVFGGRNY